MTRAGRVGSGGQSEVLGFVLLLGLSMLAIGGLLFTGTPVLDDTKQQVQEENAVTGLSQLDQRISTTALGDSDRKIVDLGLSAGELEIDDDIDEATGKPDADAAWMNISLWDNRSSHNTTIHNSTALGKVEFRVGSTAIAYQGGGVWFRDVTSPNNYSVPRSLPDIRYEDGTLTATIINISGKDAVLSGELTSLTAALNESVRTHPVPGIEGGRNPVSGQINLTVKSDYYRAWATYFRDKVRANKTVGVDHDRNLAWLHLFPKQAPPFQNAVLSTGGGLEITRDSIVDSYNSQLGDYNASDRQRSGTIKSNATITVSSGGSAGSPEIYGTIKTRKNIEVSDGSKIFGDAAADGRFLGGGGGSDAFTNNNNTACPIQNDNEIRTEESVTLGGCNSSRLVKSNPGVRLEELIDVAPLIKQRLDDAGSYTEWSCSDTSIGTGSYVVSSDNTCNDQEYTFDTAGGPIEITITNSTNFIMSNVTYNVTSTEHAVQIYRGDHSSDTSFRWKDNSSVKVPDNKTGVMQLYVWPGEDTGGTGPKIRMFRNASYHGVIYAPNNDRIFLGKTGSEGSEVFGAVVAEKTRIINSDVHYDQALRGLQLDVGASRDRINYLYVSDNRVDLEP